MCAVSRIVGARYGGLGRILLSVLDLRAGIRAQNFQPLLLVQPAPEIVVTLFIEPFLQLEVESLQIAVVSCGPLVSRNCQLELSGGADILDVLVTPRPGLLRIVRAVDDPIGPDLEDTLRAL